MAKDNSITYPTRHANWKWGCKCQECKQYVSDYNRAWRKLNPRKYDPVKRREYRRRYYASENGKRKKRQHRLAHAERHKASIKERRKEHDRKFYLRNRARILARKQQYRKAHPEVFHRYAKSDRGRANNLQKQAQRRGAAGTCSPQQLRARWDYYGQRCYLCGGPANCTDHVIPIVKGGTNWPANLRPACRPCNAKKQGMHLNRYLQLLKESPPLVSYAAPPSWQTVCR